MKRLDLIEIIKRLDGCAAVNLAEPSTGDLERIYKAYLTERERVRILTESNTDLVEALDKISIYPLGVPPEEPQPTEIEYAMAEIAVAAVNTYINKMKELK